MGFEVQMRPGNEIIADRGLQRGGRVQKYIDQECIRRMARYTPKRTGTLIRAATLHTVIGRGRIMQYTPYAKSMYYNNTGHGIEGAARGGLRGRQWFARMKNAHGNSILRGARRLSGRENGNG